jgi:hypothetical protein
VSRLLIRTTYAGEFTMNVLRFSAPMFGTMMSGQTKKMMVYFPIKAQHPELQLDVIFASQAEYRAFQNFVRTHHLNALTNYVEPGVTLFWPARNIMNWTGLIHSFKAGGERFHYAERASFAIELIDSFVSQRTFVVSQAPLFDTVYGAGSPDGMFVPPDVSPGTPSPNSPFPGGGQVPLPPVPPKGPINV